MAKWTAFSKDIQRKTSLAKQIFKKRNEKESSPKGAS